MLHSQSCSFGFAVQQPNELCHANGDYMCLQVDGTKSMDEVFEHIDAALSKRVKQLVR